MVKKTKTNNNLQSTAKKTNEWAPRISLKEELEDIKGVIWSVSRRRTDNAITKKKKNKRTNNDLQNTTQKIKDWATRISLMEELEDIKGVIRSH